MAIDGRISLHKLLVFSLAVDLGSVSRAAERLVVTQPVVSAHLRSLEESLGCTLFEQRGGTRALTEAGLAVHRFAQETLRSTRELERLIAATDGHDCGRIILAAGTSLGSYRVGRVLTRFLVDHPGAEVESQSADVARIVDATITGAVDFALALGDTGITHDELETHVVGWEPFVLLAAPGVLGHAPITPSVLSSLDLIEDGTGDGSAAVRRTLHELGVRRQVTMELGHPEAVKRVVGEGTGVAFLPRCAAEREIAAGELEVVEVEGLSLIVPVQLIHRAGRRLTELEYQLLDDLRDAYTAETGQSSVHAALAM